MSKRDTKKVAKYARDAYEWCEDRPLNKKRKDHKRRERQDGKKEIRNESK